MMDNIIELPGNIFSQISTHLIPGNMEVEEVAFVFAALIQKNNEKIFLYKDHWLLQPDDFAFQSSYYFELTDETQANLIKKAHDLNASIIEFHSHVDQPSARFSHTDWTGFLEFVPHVFWRLKNKPYAAVVVTPGSFDAIAWMNAADKPELLKAIRVDGTLHHPTNNSYKKWVNGSGTI